MVPESVSKNSDITMAASRHIDKPAYWKLRPTRFVLSSERKHYMSTPAASASALFSRRRPIPRSRTTQCHATLCAMWVCMMHGLLYIPPWECHLELEYPGWMWISDSDVAEQSKRYRQRRRRLRWTRNRLRCAKASWRQRSLRKVLRKLT